ncbi:hypothetical protein PPE_05150 [Paenibacillus polymyxa E681]|nr:hypothetical protein PPE_05150 [Paenibacillus polymyxa E681]
MRLPEKLSASSFLSERPFKEIMSLVNALNITIFYSIIEQIRGYFKWAFMCTYLHSAKNTIIYTFLDDTVQKGRGRDA